MSRKLIVVFIVVLVIVLCNVLSPTPNIAYSNYTGSFTFEEMNFQERNFEMCKAKFRLFIETGSKDTILYRITKKNSWRFWNWGEYWFGESYRLQYMDWEGIAARRGVLVNKSGFQDF